MRDGPPICKIWGVQAYSALRKPSAFGGAGADLVNSPRAGGMYKLHGEAAVEVQNADNNLKVGLTDWIIEQNRFGITPLVDRGIVDEAKLWKRKNVFQRADGLLRYLSRESDLLGSVVSFLSIDNSKKPHVEGDLLAWTSSTSISEVIALAEYCAEERWIFHEEKTRSSTSNNNLHSMKLLPQGFARLAELDGANSESPQAFVAMWFDDTMTDAWERGIKPAIEGAGYKSLRIDNVEHINKIDDEIIAEIRRSRFVVADFTSERDKPRGGVYFEAGFAQGLNIPVIWTCRHDLINYVHFDTRQFNHIVWTDPTDLHQKLQTRIEAVIGDGPLKNNNTRTS